jgi:cobalt-zinc-cadmium efflux system membrane fusion protein
MMFKAICAMLALLALPIAATAHGGEDHGDTPVVVAGAAPSAEASSERYEAVIRVVDDRLTVWLDDYRSNAPVAAARVSALIGDKEFALKQSEPGTYVAAADIEFPAGDTEIGLTIQAPGGDDLLSATLTMPKSAPTAAAGFAWRPFLTGAAVGIGGLLLGLLVFRRRRRETVAVLILLAISATGSPEPAEAHEGEDHGAAVAETGGERALRLPDGTVFLPKPSQRILGVRTIVAIVGSGAATASMPATVIADPSHFARVATARGGRLLPLAGGFPRLGERVAAGAALFRVAPSLSATEASASAISLRGLDRDIVLAMQDAARLRSLKGIVSDADMRRAEATLAGLRAQRAAAAGPVSDAEIVRAPFAGTIARVAANVGEVAAPGQVIIDIEGDGALLVEALAPPALLGRQVASADAVGSDGRRIGLALVGRSPGVQGGVERLQFRPRAVAGLRIGTPLTIDVILTGGAVRSGFIVPATAVVQGANGETIVWSKRRPELFAPRVVRVTALPGGARLVTSGISAGDRIVSEAAGLIAQIR